MKIQLAIYSAFIFSFSSLALIVPEAGGQKPGSAPERSLSSEQDADPEQEKDNESATEPAPENAAPLQQKKLASAVAKAITIRTNKFRKENGLDKLKSD